MRHKALCLLLIPLLLATACSRLTFVRPKMERKDGEQIAQDYSVKDSPEVKRRQSVQMMLSRSVQRLQAGDLDTAEKEAKAALKLAPDSADAVTMLAGVAGRRGQTGAAGQLTTMGGRPVVGDNGALTVPPGSAVSIASNGLVGSRDAASTTLTGIAEVGRLKLVNPPVTDLVRGDDGLFRMRADLPPAEADEAVTLISGAIEGSNVQPVDAMVAMIANARSFEMQMKSLQTADINAQTANKLLAYG